MIATLAAAVALAHAGADWTPGVGMGQALGTVVGTVEAASGRLGDLRYDTGVSLLGAFLRPGQSIGFDKTFTSSENVLVIAGGAGSAGDVDLEIIKNGTVTDSDTEEDSDAVVGFSPSGRHTLRLTLASGRPSFVCVVILRVGYGWKVPIRDLTVAGGDVIDTAGAVAGVSAKAFWDGANNWCLFGGVAEAAGSFTVTGLQLTGRDMALVGGCDEDSDDVDMFLYDSSGSLVRADEEDDDHPVIGVPRSLSGARVKIYNAGSKPTFSLFAILKS